MSMGNWKLKKLPKELQGRRNSTSSKKARVYISIPPETGWPGGRPEDNDKVGRKQALS